MGRSRDEHYRINVDNSGLAIAAYLGKEGHKVTLWNRSKSHISKLMETHTIIYRGVMEGETKIHQVTDDIKKVVENRDITLITTQRTPTKNLRNDLVIK